MIHLRYFASLREALGCDSELVEWQAAFTSVNNIKQFLAKRSQLWHAALISNNTINAAVNQQLATQETLVKDGDEVAFFPPVTGG